MFGKPCKDDKLNDNELKEVEVDKLKNKELIELDRLRPQTKYYSSFEVKKDMGELVLKKVVGTDYSALDFIQVMLEAECTVYLLGGSVRDTLMGKVQQVKDIDIDTCCEVDKVKELCEKNFDKKHCFIFGNFFQFGSQGHQPDRLDIAVNEDTFQTPQLTCLEYSPNALAYEYGIDFVVVDFTGFSVRDACTKQIRIPIAKDDMDAWANERVNDGGRKIFRSGN